MANNTSTGGGGGATHAGTNYQDYVAAWVAVQILAEQDVTPPWGLPATVMLESLHAETPNPIDDLTVHTSAGGRALSQAKHTVNLETTATSPLGSTIVQFVAEYCTPGKTFDPAKDRFVLITSPLSSAGVKTDLPALLTRMRTSSHPDAEWTAGNADQQHAANVLRNHLTREWQTIKGTPPTTAELTELTRLIHIHILDVDPGGQAAQEAKNTLRQRILKDPTNADAAWNTLITTTGTYATNHQRADRPALQRALTDAALDLQAQRSYRDDIEQLKTHATTTLATLLDFSRIHVGTQPITIQRAAATDARNAATQGHLLILGTPGAGKSGVLYDVASTLAAQGADVVLFAVDHLEAASTGALRNELGLTHELTSILAAWPGTQSGYLIIDALDAARTTGAARTLQTIMEHAIANNGRWRVIASVRKFDLRYNPKLQRLFLGTPPSPHMDTEFSTTRHVNVPVLTEAELNQLAQQAPALDALVAAAPPPLKELLHVPFNLRLLAELLSAGIAVTELQPLKTQVELLDRYWTERIIRQDGQGDARELILRRTTDAMVQQRALRIPRTAAINNDLAASTILTGLLSAHVLAEWTTPAGAAQHDIITFPHHLLFDYAVARLSIPPDHATFVARLTAEPDLLLAIRPSIELHYQRLWHDDPASFWDLTFRAIRAGMPEIGKLIGPSIAALHAETVARYQPLLDKLDHNDLAEHEEGMGALRHVLNTLLANAHNTSAKTTPWCALIDACTATITLELAGTIRPSVWSLAERAETLTATERNHLGAVVRRLLTFVLSIAPDDRGLLIAAITAVNKTATTDPTASVALLRECITPERLQTIGYRTLRVLADGVATLAAIDPTYVQDLYLAALRHQDTSQETTSMIESQIMGFTSQRQQDYKGGFYTLGEHYPVFLERAPGYAVATLLGALDVFAQEHHHTSTHQLPVNLDDMQATLVPDRSHSWDGMGIYEHDLPVTMLGHLQARLQALGDEDNSQAIQNLLNELTTAPVPAVVWRRLLLAGTHRPTKIGSYLHSLAWDPTILTSQDTTRTAGTFIRPVHPTLDSIDRERIEQAILAIPTNGPTGTHDRDRLLGCLDAAHIVNNSASQHHATLVAQGGAPSNIEDNGAMEWMPTSTPPPADALQALIDPVTSFIGQHLNSLPDATAITNTLPLLQALHDRIMTPTEPIGAERATTAMNELLRATTRIVRAGGLTDEQCARLLPIILAATTHTDPEHSDEEDQSRPVTGWSESPRISAAEAAILLARYTSACTTELRTALKQLSTDPVRVVRIQIASHLGSLYWTAPDLFWELVEYYAANEPNPTLLVDTLHTLRRVPVEHAVRVVALAEQILNRTPITSERSDVRDACMHVFYSLALHANDAKSAAILDGFINDPVTYKQDVHRLILDLSVEYTATEIVVRERAFNLTQRSLTAIIAAMHNIEAANDGVTPWPPDVQKQFGGLLRCADEIAQRLYFASGVFKNPSQDRTFLPADVFYEHAKPILTQLADIGHPHTAHQILEALVHFIAIDPADVLILAGHVVRTGSKYGYQYEQLAEKLMVDMVEQYLAEHRPLLRERPDCHTALMDILDIFVRVGWPRAHQLTYHLSDIYR
jgi:signal recognition particle GTPase